MSSIQVLDFRVLISVLEKSAEQLQNQHKDEAQKTISGISNEIQSLADVSSQKESEYKQAQQELSNQISEIIQKEVELSDSSLGVNRKIDELKKELEKASLDGGILKNQISSLIDNLQNTQNKIREHQAKLDELNDSSAVSIIRSIFSLGIDRAAMGITSLIDDDAGHIRSLNDELTIYQNEIQQDNNNIRAIQNTMNLLDQQKRSYEALVAELSKREIVLQENEKSCRQKLAYFTDVALFYGKLLIMSQQVEHKIDDVVDIVEELNDSTPTIIDFDGSGKDLIALRQALIKFDQLVSDKTALNNT